ncbi:subunit beta of DNA-directed RNA polymerase [Hamiltosporidium tvaerminnensis]|uniref:DNA-directed RNA polymerase subunit beta n=1 Tax=Hamiltosporidium tvaerminnensis TaxID=1176355 RepID=A0A4Q9LTB0_9MICR|nr:subunit beta of DNA-directed RNA polymerase [Hamiltosporidium tvaerminnensis]
MDKNTAASKLVESFLKEKGLVRQHIDSFNYFIQYDIKNILKANEILDSDVDQTFYLKYTDIRVGMPTIEENMVAYEIYPHECRLRDMTYAANIYVDVEYVRNKQIVIKKDVCIGKIPIMLRSKRCYISIKTKTNVILSKETENTLYRKLQECPLDTGGYFIVKGVERVILIQEQLSKNRIIVDLDAKGNICASVTSSTHDKKSKTVVVTKNHSLYVKHNSFIEEIPLVVVVRAMGLSTDKEIAEGVGCEEEVLEYFAPSIEMCHRLGIFTEIQAIEYIGNRIRVKYNQDKIEEAKCILNEIILPNVIITDLNYKIKGLYILIMARRLIQAQLGILSLDDRDFIGNKRFELAGQLLSLMFEDLFKRYNSELKKSIDKVLSKISRAQEFDALTFMSLQVNLITTAFVRAISTGNWTLKRFRMERSGITQVLSRLSYISALGMMTRICSQFEKTRKISGPRSLHTSYWGYLCPSDTPEGESCGLVKNLALLAEITTDSPYEDVLKLLFTLGMEDINILVPKLFYMKNTYLVFLNGMVVGVIQSPDSFIQTFKKIRRKGGVNGFVSIYKNEPQKTVNISTDNGRICRPLLIVENGRVLFTQEDGRYLKEGYKTFDTFVNEGKIEFLDANEENDSLIATIYTDLCSDTTHLEIQAYTILGYVAGLIPNPHHNQSPRNTYQCAMGKQAMGVIGYNQYRRFDTLLYLLTYPQKPLARTKTIELINFEKLPAGQNAMVAVMGFSGYDIEDALILNKSSLDRGFGRCEVYRSFSSSLKRYANGSYDVLSKGDNSYKNSVLDLDGLSKPGEIINDGQIYVNKYSPVSNESNIPEYKFTGLVYRNSEPSVVDKVIVTKSGEDLLMVKTLLRQVRRPEIGDKFSSRHGQKGVIGMIFEQQDMPFNEFGMCPDIIMNPHGFPSRMTVGKIIELLSGKCATLSGEFVDSSAFNNFKKYEEFHDLNKNLEHLEKNMNLGAEKETFRSKNIESIDDLENKVKSAEKKLGNIKIESKEDSDSENTCVNKVDEISDYLVKNGFSYSGKDCFTCGNSGRQIEAYIFYGPVYYQKLKHMVTDKMHARARGPRAVLTRQPTEGRSRDGGLRLGEMERDCLIGYGASSLLIERLMVSSDAFQAYICHECGIIVHKDGCVMCDGEPVCIQIPYACKLLFQELMAMNIYPKFKFE